MRNDSVKVVFCEDDLIGREEQGHLIQLLEVVKMGEDVAGTGEHELHNLQLGCVRYHQDRSFSLSFQAHPAKSAKGRWAIVGEGKANIRSRDEFVRAEDKESRMSSDVLQGLSVNQGTGMRVYAKTPELLAPPQ